MKWSLVSKMNNSNFWTLQDNEKLRAEMRYNRDAQSIRINAGDRRLYFLEQIGYLQNRMELKTEYSIVIGETYFNKDHLSGITILDGQKYSFTIEDDQLNLFENHRSKTTVSIEHLDQLDVYEFSALLFGFCISHLKTKMKREYEVA